MAGKIALFLVVMFLASWFFDGWMFGVAVMAALYFIFRRRAAL